MVKSVFFQDKSFIISENICILSNHVMPIYKYGGRLVHLSHDEAGLIEVVEKDGVRSLHFGSHSSQSAMSLKDPNSLHSLYARALMGLLLFHDLPQNVLMVGLGGGVLPKYLLQQFSECTLKVIEFRPGVVKIARSHFNLPIDPRLKIKIGCGAQYMQRKSRVYANLHDLIIVDAFDEQGMVPEVSRQEFFDNCRTLLTGNGLLAINLWGTDEHHFKHIAWNIGRIFDWRILFLPVRQRGNIICFAFGKNMPKPSMKELQHKARLLEQQYHLEFPVFVQDFKRNNNKVLSRVIRK